MEVSHKTNVLIGDYQFADKVKEQVLSLLKLCNPISQDNSNVKASLHTEWNWQPNNITFRNLKEYIREEIETYYKPGFTAGGGRSWIISGDFLGKCL